VKFSRDGDSDSCSVIGDGHPSPRFPVSVAPKGVTALVSVSVDSARVAGGRFRPKDGETRRLAASVADKGLSAIDWQGFESGESGCIRGVLPQECGKL
jgi:hypothetical protein